MEQTNELIEELAERKATRRVERAALVGFGFGAIAMLVALLWTGAVS